MDDFLQCETCKKPVESSVSKSSEEQRYRLLSRATAINVDMHNVSAASKTFAQETTIHGIKEAWKTRNKTMKLVWLLILMSCFCGVSYEIYQVVVYYRSNPSATQVKWVVQDKYDYPDMVFCPRTFLDEQKVKLLNMSETALAYTVSLFQPVTQLPDDFNLVKAREEVNTLMQKKNYTRYMDLFSAMAFDGKVILVDAQTRKPLKLEPIVPGISLCYKIHLPRFKSSTIKNVKALELEHFPTVNQSMYDNEFGATLLIRDATGSKNDMIMLTKQAFYNIHFQVQVHRRISRTDAECFGSKEVPQGYYITDCEWACLDQEKYTSGCRDCLPFQMIKSWNTGVLPCTNLDAGFFNNSKFCDTESVIGRAKECLSTCLPVCEQWIYTHTTLTFEQYNTSLLITIVYNPSFGILTYEEVSTYTFDTFISNVGGQLGLWLGASIVSIFQIFYYICGAMCRQEDRIINTV